MALTQQQQRRSLSWRRCTHLLATLAVSSTFACQDAEAEPCGTRIGLLLPFTGSGAGIGDNLEQAAMLALELVNQHRRPRGGSFCFVVRDTHSDPERGFAAAKEILAEDVVALIGPGNAELATRLYPELRARQVLFMSPYISASLENGAAPEFPWFRLAPTGLTLGRAFALEVYRNLGINELSVLYVGDAYDQDFANAFVDRYESLDGLINTAVALSPGRTSYTTQIGDASIADLDQVVLVADASAGARVVDDVTTGWPVPSRRWLLAPLLKTEAFLENIVFTNLDGSLGIAPLIARRDPDFVSAFRERWHGDGPLEGAYYYFDAVALLSVSFVLAEAVKELVAASQGTYAFHDFYTFDLSADEESAAADTKVTYAELREAVKMVAHPRGANRSWTELTETLDGIKDGTLNIKNGVTYVGLSGDLNFGDSGTDGQVQYGRYLLWSIVGNQIVEP